MNILRSIPLYFIPLIIALIMLLRVLYHNWKEKRQRDLFTVLKEDTDKPDKFISYLIRTKYGSNLINSIAVKLTIISSRSIAFNIKRAGLIIEVLLGLLAFFAIVLMFYDSLWYVRLGYFCLVCFVLVIIDTIATGIIRMRFMSQLPEVLKILNSRYTTERKILKAIDLSLNDFKPVPRKVMLEISNALKCNDSKQLDLTFSDIKDTYSNEYLTILLMLIKQAYFKGGNDDIQEQLENVTEDVLADIENTKDLTSTSRMYIIFAIICSPVMLVVIERFSQAALGGTAVQYYTSPQGSIMKIVLMAVTIVYSLMMFYIEKRS